MPRKIDFDNVQDNSIEDMGGGCYVVAIQRITEEERYDTPYVNFVFDIVEGPHKGFYSTEHYEDEKLDFTHQVQVKDTSSMDWMFKRILGAISKSNPGTDAEAAYNAGKFELLFGKQFGLTANTAYAKQSWDASAKEFVRGDEIAFPRPDWRNANVCTAQDVRDGKAKQPKPKAWNLPSDDKSANGALTDYASGVDMSDVPF